MVKWANVSTAGIMLATGLIIHDRSNEGGGANAAGVTARDRAVDEAARPT